MRTDDPKIVESMLKKMDVDCAVRSVLSVLGGRKKFTEQFAIECGIMATRTRDIIEGNAATSEEDDCECEYEDSE